MRILWWVFLVLFVISFTHSCLLAGMMRKTSPTAESYENRLSSPGEAMVYFPIKLYGIIGGAMWKAPFIKDIFKRVYGPIFKKLGERGDVGTAIRIVDLRFWNAVTFVSLGIVLMLTLFLKTLARREKR